MQARVLSVMGVVLAVATPAWSAEPEASSQSAAPTPAPVVGGSADQASAPIIDDSAPAATEQGEPAAAAAEKPSTPGKLPGAGEDLKLRKEIQRVFRKDVDLKNNPIAVTVDNCNTDEYSTNCNVTLAGAVDSQAERIKAEQVARVKGVVLIHNLLDLGGDATDGIADGAVTASVRQLLLADPAFKSSIISIATAHGVVTLVGTVPSDALRRQAGEKARLARAVKRVDNALRVEPELQIERRPPAVVSQ